MSPWYKIMALAPMAQYTLAQAAYGSHAAAGIPGASSFVAPAGFPTTAFSTYYPVPSGQEPQPALYDPVLNITYPLNLTSKYRSWGSRLALDNKI